MPEPENELDAAILDSEIKESENEIDLDNKDDTHDGAAESQTENNEDEGAQASDGTERQVETHRVTAEKLSARRGQFARADEPYDWNLCTTVITLQLMPPRAEQDAAARKVFLTARTHAEPPYTANMRWSDLEPHLPDELKALLTRLQQDLPQRAAKRAVEEQAEREREKERQAQAERRATEKKGKEKTKASTPRTLKRSKKVDLNTPPAVTASQEQIESESASAPNEIETPVATPFNNSSQANVNADPSAQMSLF